MQYDEFIERVQEQAGLETRDEAIHLTEVVLSTLGERLYRTEIESLAAQLPGELKGLFFERQRPENTRQETDRFALEEFYNRISARANTNRTRAAEQAQAVVAVVREAVSPGLWQNVASELPSEYGELFGEERKGSASS